MSNNDLTDKANKSDLKVTVQRVSTSDGNTLVSYTASEEKLVTIMCFVSADNVGTSNNDAIINLTRDGVTSTLTRGHALTRTGASVIFTVESGDVISLSLNVPAGATNVSKVVTSNVIFS
jgi:hypothetical protein